MRHRPAVHLLCVCVFLACTAADETDRAAAGDTLSRVALAEAGATEQEIAREAASPVDPAAPAPEPDKSRTAGPRLDVAPADRALPPSSLIERDPVAYLRALDLLIPVAGITRDELPPSSFRDARGERTHEAYDIHAPRGTPVLAATSGSIARLHLSDAGGNMIYTYDASGRFVLFYAHLDRYHPGLEEGMPIERGDTIGYVGTTGNAPPGVPHLHFPILLMDEDRQWWSGTPIDPQPLLARNQP